MHRDQTYEAQGRPSMHDSNYVRTHMMNTSTVTYCRNPLLEDDGRSCKCRLAKGPGRAASLCRGVRGLIGSLLSRLEQRRGRPPVSSLARFRLSSLEVDWSADSSETLLVVLFSYVKCRVFNSNSSNFRFAARLDDSTPQLYENSEWSVLEGMFHDHPACL